MNRVIKFNQEACLRPYTNIRTKLRKHKKNNFEKDFFKLMNSASFGKTLKIMRKHRNIELLQPKQERIIWYQNQTIIQQNFFKNIYQQ